MQIKMSLTIYTVVRLVSAIDNTGCFTAYFILAHVVDKAEMRQVSVEELRQMASDCRESIWAQAQSVGREPKTLDSRSLWPVLG